MALPMWKISFGFSVIFSLYFCQTSCDEEFESLSTLMVEHTFDQGNEPTYSKRGTITIQSLKAGIAEYVDEEGISPEERDLLKDLVKQNGLYHLRVRGKSTTGDDNLLVTTFVHACSLYESRLSDLLTLNVDQSGNLLAITLTTTSPYCHGVDVRDADLVYFNTSVEVIQTVTGPAPETQNYIQKMEQEEAAKAKGQEGDNRSFFAKYWMYIVPVFIFLMFASNQDQGQGGGGGGGGGR